MASKDESGLEGHDSGGVKIAARNKAVFCFPDGTIVLTDEAVSWRAASAPKDEQSRAGYGR